MGEFKHSPVLFTTEDGMPLLFYVPSRILTEHQNLLLLIEHGGGIVETEPDSNVIHLVENDTKILNCKDDELCVKVQFIRDCIDANMLYDVSDYKIRVKHDDVSDISDKEDNIENSLNKLDESEEKINETKCSGKQIETMANMLTCDISECTNIDNDCQEHADDSNQDVKPIKKKPVPIKKKLGRSDIWSKDEDQKLLDFFFTHSHEYDSRKESMYKFISENLLNRSSSGICNHLFYILKHIDNYNLTIDQRKLMKKFFAPKIQFSLEDDLQMINYIIKHNYYSRATGKWIYKQMVKDKIIEGKHPMAMSKRFRSKILPNLDDYGLLPRHVEKLKKKINSCSLEDENVEYKVKSDIEDSGDCKTNKAVIYCEVSKKVNDSRKKDIKSKIGTCLFKTEQIDSDLLSNDINFCDVKKNTPCKASAVKKRSKNSRSNNKALDSSKSVFPKRIKMFDPSDNYLNADDKSKASHTNSEKNEFKITSNGSRVSDNIPNIKVESSDDDFEILTEELFANQKKLKKSSKWYNIDLCSLSLPDSLQSVSTDTVNQKSPNSSKYHMKSVDSSMDFKEAKPSRSNMKSKNSITISHGSSSSEENSSVMQLKIESVSSVENLETYDSQVPATHCLDERMETFSQNQNESNSILENGALDTFNNIFYNKTSSILQDMKCVISNMQSSDQDKSKLLNYIADLNFLLYKWRLQEQASVILTKEELTTEDKCCLLKYATCQQVL